MKTFLRVLVLAGGVFVAALCLGSKEEEAKADVPSKTGDSPALEVAATATGNAAVAPKTPEAKPSEVVLTGANTNAPVVTNSAALTNLATANLATNVILGPTIPESLKLSKPMSDMVKLVQAGVGEQILLAYVSTAGDPFDAGSNEIIYLNDLGVSANVITAMLQHDSTSEMQARKQALNAVQPLPPGVALSSPATNIYTPKETTQPVQNPPEPSPVGQPGANSGSILPVSQPAAVYSSDEAGGTYDAGQATTAVTYNYWYSSLAPYGSWISVGGYGHCWRPTVSVCNSSWRPYADCGRWVWSNCGWYWYSDYSWGWGPFHYGRWACPPGVGWVWVPGSTWGPAWVSWRYTPSYCGWAPLPPAAHYGYGSGFYYNGLSVGVGCDFGLAASAYVFLPVNRFCDRRPYNYYVSSAHGHAIYRDSTVANHYAVGKNHTVVNNGIGVDRIAQVTKGDIRQVALKDTSSVRDLGMRREQLATDGATLAVHRPDASTISRLGALAPPPKPGVSRPAVVRPGAFSPSREPNASLNAGAGFNQAKLTQPSTADSVPRGGVVLPRPGGSTGVNRPVGSTPGTPLSGTNPGNRDGSSTSPGTRGAVPGAGPANPNSGNNPGRSGAPSIVMRSPNPGRNNANRPVTYPYVPANQTPAANSPGSGITRPGARAVSPGQSSSAAPSSSFVPGPPAGAPRAPYHAAPPRNYSYAPGPAVAARPSYSAPAVASSPRFEAAHPSVSAPAPSRSGGGFTSGGSSGSSSSARGSDGGSVSRGPAIQVGRGR